jgi:hypothetical protein
MVDPDKNSGLSFGAAFADPAGNDSGLNISEIVGVEREERTSRITLQ